MATERRDCCVTTPAVGQGLRGLADLSALHMVRARDAHNVAGGAAADPRDNAG
jgi:hypothetical protein